MQRRESVLAADISPRAVLDEQFDRLQPVVAGGVVQRGEPLRVELVQPPLQPLRLVQQRVEQVPHRVRVALPRHLAARRGESRWQSHPPRRLWGNIRVELLRVKDRARVGLYCHLSRVNLTRVRAVLQRRLMATGAMSSVELSNRTEHFPGRSHISDKWCTGDAVVTRF